jgi:sulfite reductase alpha subunit-like flavoprotein
MYLLVLLQGPTGKVLLMPEADKALIMVATGTGIAPFRAFWRRCFYENVPNYKFTGLFWLFMGVANSDSKLYDDELQAIKVSVGAGGHCRGSSQHVQRAALLYRVEN